MIPLSQLLNESARVRCQQQEPLRYRMRPLQADPSFTDLQNCEIHRIYELLETMVSEVSVLAKSGICRHIINAVVIKELEGALP